jgi:cytochrome c-type biogenesis protein CcmE
MTPATKRRFALGGALAGLALAVTALAYSGIEKNLVYYLDAQELQAKGDRGHGALVRLGGVVQKGSVQWDPKTMALRFSVGIADQGEPSIVVAATGSPPQMFQESIGAVVEGTFDGRIFTAERVMVKHSNEYRPPAPGETPKDLYGTLEAPLDPKDDKPPAPLPHLPAEAPTPTRYE